jgi:quinol monooxygenase YgiN
MKPQAQAWPAASARPIVGAMKTIHLLISFQARTEAAADFAALLQQVKQDLPQVRGCRGVRVFRHENPCTHTLLEEWDSRAEHQSHIERVVASGDWARIRAHLAADPVSHYVTEL